MCLDVKINRGGAMHWDPAQYLTFGDERGRPFRDLVSRVRAQAPEVVVDLGCGPGNLTRELARRWPEADVEGVDSSAEMVLRAKQDGESDRLRFTQGDLREWRPEGEVDVLVSNATLQWVPDHLRLLPRLVTSLRAGGWFAFQVPGNLCEPSHRAIAQLCESATWRDRFAGVELQRPRCEEPATYLEALVATGCTVDVWETTYLQVLQGPDAIVRWMTGTGLRPVLSQLGEDEREGFLDDYRALVGPHYPQREYGTVLPYRRIFAVAQKGSPA
jgi:trans-aconitate 2-methyltransferase